MYRSWKLVEILSRCTRLKDIKSKYSWRCWVGGILLSAGMVILDLDKIHNNFRVCCYGGIQSYFSAALTRHEKAFRCDFWNRYVIWHTDTWVIILCDLFLLLRISLNTFWWYTVKFLGSFSCLLMCSLLLVWQTVQTCCVLCNWKLWCEAFVFGSAADCDGSVAQSNITNTRSRQMTFDRASHAINTTYKGPDILSILHRDN